MLLVSKDLLIDSQASWWRVNKSLISLSKMEYASDTDKETGWSRTLLLLILIATFMLFKHNS